MDVEVLMPKSKSKALAKRAEAVRLFNEGLSFDDIALRVGYSHRGTAHTAVMQGFRERIAEHVDERRARELLSLEQIEGELIHVAINATTDSVKVRALSQMINISKQRSRLLGLHDKGPEEEKIKSIFDLRLFQLRKPNTCSLNNDYICGFDPSMHGDGCGQELAGEVMDPGPKPAQTQEKPLGPAAQTESLDHRPFDGNDFMV
jgi:hypothetical protein